MPFLQLKDTELYFEVHGHGRPMVFLSETACDGEIWKLYQVAEFSRDYRVILHDYRGTGRSGKPSIEYSTKMFCDDLVALMDHLRAEHAIVVGHSMGGRVAQLLALEHPDKADKLILASTGAAFPATKGLPLKICKEMIEWGYEKYVRDHSILVGFTDECAKKYPDRVEKYLQVRMSNLCPVEFYLRHLIARQSHDTSGRLKDIRVPTLILVGEDDRNVTSDINHRSSSEILAEGIPNSKLVVLSGERHSYFFANPDVAHKTIREFLAGC
ncbi:MAG TPA: alpha/beta hydrolase [Candidatus Binatia bacterium]|nr:alpha/beta hydrolase [Candidatus Binatia bacterium]